MRVHRRASVSALLAVALGASAAPASAASGTTRWVDQDGHAGPGSCTGTAVAASASIQGAITASGPGDTVVVCPGTYEEQVHIQGARDGLTVRSSIPFGATIKTPTSLGGFAALVVVDHVDHVTVRGFKTIARTQAPCDDLEVAFAGVGSRDVSFRGNRVLAPGTGPGADCYMGVGMGLTDTVDDGEHAHVASGTIAYNEVRDAAFLSIVAVAQRRSVHLDTVGNSVRAYFGAVHVTSSSVADIEGAQFGIGYLGHASGTIRDNVVQGSAAFPDAGGTFYAGIGVASGFDFDAPGHVNGPITIRDNTVRRVIHGIYLDAADHVAVRHNQVRNAWYGILLNGTTESSVRANSVRAREYGIGADEETAGNVLRGNVLNGAGGLCLDKSAGSGTAGTANTWSGNTAAHPSTPSGICSVPR